MTPRSIAAVADALWWWLLFASPCTFFLGPQRAAAQVYKCHEACSKCHLFDYDQSWHCTECKPGFELWVDGCFEPCHTGQYRYGYECHPCTYNCDECVGTMRHECTKCSPGYEFDMRHVCVKQYPSDDSTPRTVFGWYPSLDGRSCGECDAYCESCIAPYRISCKSCFPGYTLRIHEDNTSTGECLANCDEGWYREASNDNRCIQCAEYCLECEKIDTCLRCWDNATLYRGLCYSQPSFALETAIDFDVYMSSGATPVNFSDPNKPHWEDLFERRLQKSDECVPGPGRQCNR